MYQLRWMSVRQDNTIVPSGQNLVQKDQEMLSICCCSKGRGNIGLIPPESWSGFPEVETSAHRFSSSGG